MLSTLHMMGLAVTIQGLREKKYKEPLFIVMIQNKMLATGVAHKQEVATRWMPATPELQTWRQED